MNPEAHDPVFLLRFSRFARMSGAVAAALGVVVLIGWASGTEILKTGLPGMIAVKPNGAACGLLLGISLFCRCSPASRAAARILSRVGLAVVLIASAVTLAEHLFSLDLFIDDILFLEPPGRFGSIHPGRMAFNSTISFLTLGLGMLLQDLVTPPGRAALVAQTLALAAFAVALTALVGYLYEVPTFIGPAAFTRMPLLAAVMCLLLSSGLFLARPGEGLAKIFSCDTAGGFMARRLMLAIPLIIVLMGKLGIIGQSSYRYFGTAFMVIVGIAVCSILIYRSAVSIHERDLRHRRMVEDLRRSNKELESFSYSVAHDLRTPLRGIDGFSLALLEDYGDKLDGQARDYLRRVRRASQHMGKIIDGLLELSRLARREIHAESVDLSGLARRIAEQLQAGSPDRRAVFAIADGLEARGDPELLGIVLNNLLDNAWKFTGRTPQALIEFGVMDADARRPFFVRDNGAGFDMAYADKLFKLFERLHTLQDFPGTGIGLAAVSLCLQRHGGRIWAEGAPGKGAVFSFTIPGPTEAAYERSQQ